MIVERVCLERNRAHTHIDVPRGLFQSHLFGPDSLVFASYQSYPLTSLLKNNNRCENSFLKSTPMLIASYEYDLPTHPQLSNDWISSRSNEIFLRIHWIRN